MYISLPQLMREIIEKPRDMASFMAYADIAGEQGDEEFLDIFKKNLQNKQIPTTYKNYINEENFIRNTISQVVDEYYLSDSEGVHVFPVIVLFDDDLNVFDENIPFEAYHAIFTHLIQPNGWELEVTGGDPIIEHRAKHFYSTKTSLRQAEEALHPPYTLGEYYLCVRMFGNKWNVSQNEDLDAESLLSEAHPHRMITWENVPKDLRNAVVLFHTPITINAGKIREVLNKLVPFQLFLRNLAEIGNNMSNVIYPFERTLLHNIKSFSRLKRDLIHFMRKVAPSYINYIPEGKKSEYMRKVNELLKYGESLPN